jgi:very-short-patch-repair endonuclease
MTEADPPLQIPAEPDPNWGKSYIRDAPPPSRSRTLPDDPLFDQFWAAYPRKIGKIGAQKAWQRVTRKSTDPALIIEAAGRFARECSQSGTAAKYITHPARWLRDGRYADAVPVAAFREARPASVIVEGTVCRVHPDFPAWPAVWGPPDGDPDSWVWTEFPISQDPEGWLLCPHCRENTIEGGEGDHVFVHPDRDSYEPANPLKTRGGYTLIAMTCACGLRLALATANHKGMFRLSLFAVTSADPEFESPVERMFWQACRDVWPPRLSDDLVPQHPVRAGGRQFYLDFALLRKGQPNYRIGFEIDGHATHSSPADIAKDRQRQRLLEAAGWRIIRFGGSEVHRDARRCAAEALRHVQAYRPPADGRPAPEPGTDPWASAPWASSRFASYARPLPKEVPNCLPSMPP